MTRLLSQHPERPAGRGAFIALGKKNAEIPFLLAALIAGAVRNEDLAVIRDAAQHNEVPAAGKMPGRHDRDYELAVLQSLYQLGPALADAAAWDIVMRRTVRDQAVVAAAAFAAVAGFYGPVTDLRWGNDCIRKRGHADGERGRPAARPPQWYW